jgi:hypothetical protein
VGEEVEVEPIAVVLEVVEHHYQKLFSTSYL